MRDWNFRHQRGQKCKGGKWRLHKNYGILCALRDNCGIYKIQDSIFYGHC